MKVRNLVSSFLSSVSALSAVLPQLCSKSLPHLKMNEVVLFLLYMWLMKPCMASILLLKCRSAQITTATNFSTLHVFYLCV